MKMLAIDLRTESVKWAEERFGGFRQKQILDIIKMNHLLTYSPLMQ